MPINTSLVYRGVVNRLLQWEEVDQNFRTLIQNDQAIVAETQPISAKLTALAASVWAANQMQYQTGTGTVANFVTTAYGRSLLNLADGTALRLAAAAEPTIAAGTSSQYWNGAKAWVDFATSVRASVLTGFSAAVSSTVVAADTVIAALGKLQGQINSNVTAIGGKEPTINPGTSDQYYRGDKVFSSLPVAVRAVVLTGLAVTNTAVADTDTVLAAIGKLQGQLNASNAAVIPVSRGGTGGTTQATARDGIGAAKSGANNDITSLIGLTTPLTPSQGGVSQQYIEGLIFNCLDGVTFSCSSGSAYVPSLGRVVRVSSASSTTLSGLPVGAWYHAYLYETSGSGAIEFVATAPSAPYDGSARTKSGDSSRRYLGSFRTNTSGGVWPFSCDGNLNVEYLVDWAAGGFRVLAAGQAFVRTTVTVANCVPVSSRSPRVSLTHAGTTVGYVFTVSRPGTAIGSGVSVQPNGKMVLSVTCDDTQAVAYSWNQNPASVSSSAYIDVGGYKYER